MPLKVSLDILRRRFEGMAAARLLPQRIVKGMGVRGAKLVCTNMLGSNFPDEVELALNNLPRPFVLAQIYQRLMERRFVHEDALRFYAHSPEVSKEQLFDVLGISGKEVTHPRRRQLVAEALRGEEQTIYSKLPFNRQFIGRAQELFPELGAQGDQLLLLVPGARIPAEVMRFVEWSADRLISEGKIEKSEIEALSRSSYGAKVIAAKYPEAGKDVLIRLACDREERVAALAYENMEGRGLIDEEARLGLVNADYWWVRRSVINDPRSSRYVLEKMEERYIGLLITMIRRDIKRGRIPGLSNPDIISSSFSNIAILLALTLKMDLLGVPTEAHKLTERLYPNFKQFYSDLFTKVVDQVQLEDLLRGREPM